MIIAKYAGDNVT